VACGRGAGLFQFIPEAPPQKGGRFRGAVAGVGTRARPVPHKCVGYTMRSTSPKSLDPSTFTGLIDAAFDGADPLQLNAGCYWDPYGEVPSRWPVTRFALATVARKWHAEVEARVGLPGCPRYPDYFHELNGLFTRALDAANYEALYPILERLSAICPLHLALLKATNGIR